MHRSTARVPVCNVIRAISIAVRGNRASRHKTIHMSGAFENPVENATAHTQGVRHINDDVSRR